jgi:hypothetical protein
MIKRMANDSGLGKRIEEISNVLIAKADKVKVRDVPDWDKL